MGKETFFFFFFLLLQFFYVLEKKNRCGSVVQEYKEAKLRDEKIFTGREQKGGGDG